MLSACDDVGTQYPAEAIVSIGSKKFKVTTVVVGSMGHRITIMYPADSSFSVEQMPINLSYQQGKNQETVVIVK
jgi:hypothetical protein